MNFKNIMSFLIMFIFLFIGDKTYADGRLVHPTLQWQGGEGTLNFHPENIYTLISDDGEYAINYDLWGNTRIKNSSLIGIKIFIGSKNGFSPFKKVEYAIVPVKFSVSQGETIYASLNANNELVLTSQSGLTDYPNGKISLTQVKRESQLKLINESSLNTYVDPNEVVHLNNGSKITLTSKQNKHTLLFEDMGWNKYNPEAQDKEPLRRIKVWLETESLTDHSERYKRLYAVIDYSYTEAPIDDNGTYLVDLPIEILIDQNSQVQMTVDAEVSYPFGPLFLN